eukprot:2592232-Pyramimonas_sp.AAC.1
MTSLRRFRSHNAAPDSGTEPASSRPPEKPSSTAAGENEIENRKTKRKNRGMSSSADLAAARGGPIGRAGRPAGAAGPIAAPAAAAPAMGAARPARGGSSGRGSTRVSRPAACRRAAWKGLHGGRLAGIRSAFCKDRG